MDELNTIFGNQELAGMKSLVGNDFLFIRFTALRVSDPGSSFFFFLFFFQREILAGAIAMTFDFYAQLRVKARLLLKPSE